MAAKKGHVSLEGGPEAAARFEANMNRLLRISKAELDKREAAYKKARRAKKTRASRAR